MPGESGVSDEPRRSTLREEDDAKVAPAVRATAAWTWRLLIIGVGVAALAWLFHRFEDVLFPTALALLLTAMLRPSVEWATGKRVPRIVAVLTAVIATIVVVIGLVAFAVQQGVASGSELVSEFTDTVNDARKWLTDSNLPISDDTISSISTDLIHWAKTNEATLASGALGTAEFAVRIGSGALLTVFLVIFFLYDGHRLWRYVTRLVPESSRHRVRGASAAGFRTLESYVRATVIVAAIDATVIGIGLALLGVPLALPLVLIIFLGSFIPIVGSFVSGTLAVVVTLTTQGLLNAVIVLAILVFVMAFESHILQPFVLGRSVRLHPVAVILAIALGLLLAGIVGGLLAVPLVAFLDTAFTWNPDKKIAPPEESRFSKWLRKKFGPLRREDAPTL
ncbi:AI-2E family transporter [Gordonia liuliyuniae]|uniref:AI-2E family transporter n=1 Tax=Gordonia liuliyuniae TaxID=2911517 RepID=A0ABS9ITA9_9ACTN|nr:AI-2E family transporter [Gordonia liuliyuniae]MCF8588745.1 AI-2E family transporter [Gordonia liuliyuniae]